MYQGHYFPILFLLWKQNNLKAICIHCHHTMLFWCIRYSEANCWQLTLPWIVMIIMGHNLFMMIIKCVFTVGHRLNMVR